MIEETTKLSEFLLFFAAFIVFVVPFVFFVLFSSLFLAEKFFNRFLGGMPSGAPTSKEMWEAITSALLDLFRRGGRKNDKR